jgi:hypothetical protein
VISFRSPLAAAVRVIDRVHRNAADVRAMALPAIATGFADRDVLMLGIADGTDGRATLPTYVA